MTPRLRVIVLGAGGELGARVCRLAAAVAGVEVVGASRSGRGPQGVPMQRAEITDASRLAGLLRAGDLVANCVGPYHYDPQPVVTACLTARAHYCDLADDVAFAERVRAAAAGAREAGVFACTGASTAPGLIDVLGGAFAASPRAVEIARVSAYLSVGSANPVSAGLLASLVAPLGRVAPEGERWFASLRALRAGDGRTLRFGAYPAPFAGGCVAVGARRVPARFFFGFDRAALTALLKLAAPTLGSLSPAAASAIARGLAPLANAARPFGTPLGLLAVVAESAKGSEIARIEVAARARGLDIPAAPPAWIAARLASGHEPPAGAIELSEILSCTEVLAWIRGVPEYEVRASGSVAA